eukprot:124003-Chlamydomonas_euryale.AAC.17
MSICALYACCALVSAGMHWRSTIPAARHGLWFLLMDVAEFGFKACRDMLPLMQIEVQGWRPACEQLQDDRDPLLQGSSNVDDDGGANACF